MKEKLLAWLKEHRVPLGIFVAGWLAFGVVTACDRADKGARQQCRESGGVPALADTGDGWYCHKGVSQ